LASASYNKNVKHTLLYGGGYLNNRIKELRKEHKITQDELAGAVGVTRQTIISLENGKYNASLQLAYRIARYFNRYIEDVFVFEEDV
jgi:putative transcriptional regulator